MPVKIIKLNLPKPWDNFLKAVDEKLQQPIVLHCIGGFVVGVVYGIPRTTADLDYISVVPSNAYATLEKVAGPQSVLAQKHHLCFQRVSVGDCPADYESRLTRLDLRLKMLQLVIVDPYDLLLSKLTRNLPKDREDAKAIAKSQKLTFGVLKNRYDEELRPYLLSKTEWHDNTLQLWKEFFLT